MWPVCLSHSLTLREPDESKRGRRGHLISNTSEYLYYEKMNGSSDFLPMSVLREHQNELQTNDV